MSKFFLSIICSVFVSSAFADNQPIPIVDNNEVLATSDQFIWKRSFAHAYKVGDQAVYLATHCGAKSCQLERVTKTVTAMSDSSATIENIYEDGTKDQTQITPTLYTHNLNFLKVFLTNLRVTQLNPGSNATSYSLILDSADWLVLAQPDGYGNSSTNVLDVKIRIHAKQRTQESDSPYRIGLLQGAPGLRDAAYIYTDSPVPVTLLLK
jgi:hypothetical protein